MILDLRKRILGMHLIVLVLSAAVSATTYYFGSQAVGATRALGEALLAGYDRITSLATQLDGALRGKSPDWDEARRLLSDTSRSARSIDRQLDAIAAQIGRTVQARRPLGG